LPKLNPNLFAQLLVRASRSIQHFRHSNLP
jgi:hypothetical protein